MTEMREDHDWTCNCSECTTGLKRRQEAHPSAFVGENTLSDLQVGQVVSVLVGKTLQVVRVCQVFAGGFRGMPMECDHEPDSDMWEFRADIYRDVDGGEWGGIPGLRILS